MKRSTIKKSGRELSCGIAIQRFVMHTHTRTHTHRCNIPMTGGQANEIFQLLDSDDEGRLEILDHVFSLFFVSKLFELVVSLSTIAHPHTFIRCSQNSIQEFPRDFLCANAPDGRRQPVHVNAACQCGPAGPVAAEDTYCLDHVRFIAHVCVTFTTKAVAVVLCVVLSSYACALAYTLHFADVSCVM